MASSEFWEYLLKNRSLSRHPIFFFMLVEIQHTYFYICNTQNLASFLICDNGHHIGQVISKCTMLNM